MVKAQNKKLNELPAARRQRILAEADRLHAEYVTLQEQRKAMKLTQEQLTKRKGRLTDRDQALPSDQ